LEKGNVVDFDNVMQSADDSEIIDTEALMKKLNFEGSGSNGTGGKDIEKPSAKL